jgi:hypothetical protein
MAMPGTIQANHPLEPRRETPRVDAFFEAVGNSNPFISNRATEPSRYDVDVPVIHRRRFDRLVGLAGQVLSDAGKVGADARQCGIGAMLLGGAGVGKSRLLSRLDRWARDTDGVQRRGCCLYLLNILADPERLPRCLFKSIVSLLAEGVRGSLHVTPLYRLIDGAIRHAVEPGKPSFTGKEGGGAYARNKDWPDAGIIIEPTPDRTLTPEEIEAEIDRIVDRKIEEQVAHRRLHPGSLPPDAGNLAGLSELVLAHCDGNGAGRPYTVRGVERMKMRAGRLPAYDLKVRERREDGKEIVTGVLFVTNIGLSATTALKRLLEDDQPPDHRILVTDDERRPLKVGARGAEYYRDLQKLGLGKFEHLKIGFDQCARLDALEAVVNLARAGDLAIEAPRGTNRPVAAREVIESHHRQNRYLNHPLLRPLLTEEPPILSNPQAPPSKLNEADVRQYVMAQLAFMMGTTAQAITRSYVHLMPDPKSTLEKAWPQVKDIVVRMHAENLVHAQSLDDDLFLLLRK